MNAAIDFNNFLDIPTQVVPATSFDPAAMEDQVLEFSFGTTQSLTVGFSATQLVFSGSYLVGLQAAKVLAKAKDIAVERTEVETRQAVAEAYGTSLAAAANVVTLDRALTLVSQTERDLRAMAQEGFMESVDADQMLLTRQAIEQQLSTARLQADLSVKVLLFQCGLDIDTEVVLTDKLADLTVQSVPEASQSTLQVGTLPSIEEQRQYVALAELDVKNKRAEGLPQVAAFYNSSSQAFRDPEFPCFGRTKQLVPQPNLGTVLEHAHLDKFWGTTACEEGPVESVERANRHGADDGRSAA